MNDDELKKKLSVLKSAKVPKGYWENYWPRLQMKLDRVPPKESEAPRGWLFPAFAMALPILIGVFYWGQKNAEKDILRIPHVRLISDQDDERAKHVFQEMLQLFPNRVNWITYVNGKVDFSISSVAYKDAEPLIPYVVTIPRAKTPFEARVLLRPGQEAAVHAPWVDQSAIEIKWHLDVAGTGIHMNCRLTAPDLNAAVEGDTKLKPNQGTILGALRWRAQLLQVQITRLGETAKREESKPKTNSKEEPVRI